MKATILAVIGILVSTVFCFAQTTSSSKPRASSTSAAASNAAGGVPDDQAWGRPEAGIQISLVQQGRTAVGGKLQFKLMLRNVGSAPVALDAKQEAFGWLMLAYSRQKAYVSDKIALVPLGGAWPAAISPGAVIEFETLDVSDCKAFDYARSAELLRAYVSGMNYGSIKPAGTFSRVLSVEPGRAEFTLHVPQVRQGALHAISNRIDVDIAPPDLAMMAAGERKAFIADLLAKFRQNAWSAQEAHDVAVKLGPMVVPDLASALADVAAVPPSGRMWLATAIADIPSELSAALLIGLLGDSDDRVRYCVCYHGPKQKSDKLDQAILEAAKSASDADVRPAAYALLGFLVFRGQAPQDLVKIGLDGADEPARSAARNAMSYYAGDQVVKRLRELSTDKDPQVSSAARKALEAMNKGK